MSLSVKSATLITTIVFLLSLTASNSFAHNSSVDWSAITKATKDFVVTIDAVKFYSQKGNNKDAGEVTSKDEWSDDNYKANGTLLPSATYKAQNMGSPIKRQSVKSKNVPYARKKVFPSLAVSSHQHRYHCRYFYLF